MTPFSLALAAAVVLTADPSDPFVAATARAPAGLIVERRSGERCVLDGAGIVESCAPRSSSADLTAAPSFGLGDVSAAFTLSRRLEPAILQHSANELFAFPYGTSGEPYLEFAPDSPAFWSVVRTTPQVTYVLRDDPPGSPHRSGRRPHTDVPTSRLPASVGPFVVDATSIRTDVSDADERPCEGLEHASAIVRAVAARAPRPAPLGTAALPIVDVGLGAVGAESSAIVVAAFRDGLERRAPTGFVRRTFQGHVDDDVVAALDRSRTTAMFFAVLTLRLGHDDDRPRRAHQLLEELAWRQLVRAQLLADEHRAVCRRQSPSARLRQRELREQLELVDGLSRSLPSRVAPSPHP